MNFCSQCGAPVERRIPDGDNRLRAICTQCAHIHYENPLTVVGCVAEWQGKILMCKRAIEPRLGYWTVPAGFMENGESVAAGAIRETREEALAEVSADSLLAIVDVIHARQVHLFFRGKMVSPECGAGEESLETELMDEADIPWDDIAFPSVEFALRSYFADRTAQTETIHMKEINWRRTES